MNPNDFTAADLPPDVLEQIKAQEELGAKLATTMVQALPDSLDYSPLAFTVMIQSIIFSLIAVNGLDQTQNAQVRAALHAGVDEAMDDALRYVRSPTNTPDPQA